ncbi:MAG: Protein kinase, partial [Myxococcales bacterium]|nr:Protein kinase [Myxococcales bacterium]
MLDAVTIVGRPSRRTGSTDSHAAALDQTAIPRLRMLAAIYASAIALILVILEADNAGLLVLPPVAPNNPLALAAAFAASIGLIAATYSGWRARTILAIGITYQIVGAFCITFFEQGAVAGRGVAVTCIWIMSFTLLPTRPLRAAWVAFAAAAMGPLALAVQIGRGTRPWPVEPGDWVGFSTVGVAATIAALIARVVYGLGREVADARKLGAYVLVERLGQGGMGEVWRAKHSTLVRPAAIKLIRPELTANLSPPQLEIVTQRFHQEVQATAQLHSPHTVAVYDFGQTTDGTLYYVMELLDGLELETLVQRFGPQPPERVIHFLRQAAQSLAEAHQRGLIHRDIKPANVYVCAIGVELDFIKVLDFGLVRHVSQDPHLTAANAVWGTPAYLAPESAALHRFDARSDIYSLACVAYWLLTGKTVFEGETSG